jgi:ABC-type multidrug transport system permease subunit
VKPAADQQLDAGPRPEGLLSRVLQLRVAGVLTSRYLDLKLADLGGTLILLLQAPFIGFLIGLGFPGKKENATIDFILALVAVWFGCFNACREVVKERLIFLRERRAGVPVRAYLVSKVGFLAVLAALQCLVLLVLVSLKVDLRGSLPLMFLSLFATAMSATCLGLLMSSVVKSQNSLIALVPIALIPQLIFSEVTIPSASVVVERIELAMMAAWGYDMLRELTHDTSWLSWLGDLAALFVMGVGCLVLAGVCLRLQDDD